MAPINRLITCIIASFFLIVLVWSTTLNSGQILLADPDKNESGKGDSENDGKGRNKDRGGDKNEDTKKDVDRDNDDDRKKDVDKDDDDVEKINTNYNYNFAAVGENTRQDFNFAAAGDFGCSQNTKRTVGNMLDKNPELVLPLGDLSVDNTANCWLDLVSPFNNRMQVTFGYHDVKGGTAKLDQYKKVFGHDSLYYSFEYRGVHFIVMSTLSPFNVTSDQYQFIEKDLKEASENQNIDWIVVTNYGPFYTSPSAHPAKNEIRNIYHPLFDKYGVDLVLNAHNHNYQRTYPLIFNHSKGSDPTVTNQFTTGYNGSKDGIVYAIVGTAGEGFHPLEGRQSYVATQVEGKFGFLNIEISNVNSHTKLTGSFFDNISNNIQDYFTIEKEIKNMNAGFTTIQYPLN